MEQTKSTAPPPYFAQEKAIKNHRAQFGETALSEKFWPYKHEDPSSNPQQPCQQLGTEVGTCWAGTGEAETGGSSGFADSV